MSAPRSAGATSTSSVIVTTHTRPSASAGPTGLDDATLATALSDRLTHHRDIAPTGNESPRFNNPARSHLPKTAPQEIKTRGDPGSRPISSDKIASN